ncbi:HEXOKINASE FAMILY MEMBER [Salix purpurea]|uniref:HEXOKINASE FAMILY MEMBER n=1 Tax=Salix purpurea TaxID=77065 RepID=A0A9Q0WF91_SALPP|nr:HEXOKINASE FAMILY MEMBER [Salix purpurea]
MENSAQRRLERVSGHLLSPIEVNNDLSQVLIKSGQRNNEEEEGDPVVIGGMVLDIHATPSLPLNPRTTTPGKVHYVLGGVARNIAECMSKLGTKPYMISALGNDMAGKLLLEHWNSASLSTEGIMKHQGIKTPTICNIFDTEGELAAAVASVEAVENYLTSSWIQQSKQNIFSAPVMMVDANLSLPALEASCQLAAESNTPVWFEPVSVAKSRRIVSVVKYVAFASPNEDELIAMANALSHENMFCQIERDTTRRGSVESLFQFLKPAILVLLEKGIKIVAVTLGADGVFLCSRGPNLVRFSLDRTKKYGFSGQLYDNVASSCPSSRFSGALQIERSSHLFSVHFPALPASVVRLTGAGDCLVGGTLASLCSGLDIMQSIAVGIAAAKFAVEGEVNVPSEFSLDTITDDARSIYSAAKILFHQSML